MLGTVAADQTHRRHAIIEQVNADLKGSALAHLPSGKFTANAAWLVLAATATIRRTLIHIPARVASSARRLVLHLPTAWPWEHPWTELFIQTCGPPPVAART